ncbi:Mth938-like domain-containing protein [Candidatus Coxiella mudrowiae]|uniref:Membrane spanning protein n=1 Tax=Candidatus Coxiella mudrowiae TaxID=2054173 RepID=A0ABN4HS66_9COXI|nr:Mth938-like domain-containing protein [Candidatus Coxiella mudrowiae]AKQ33729.1 putative membrane spanning protein [Candidatus Coxiella mudrowiae]
MVLTEDAGIGNYHIRAYDAESVTINKTLYTSSMIVSPYKLIPNWEPKSLEDLKPEHFQTLLSLNPEVVIFGTGKKFIFPPKEKLMPLLQKRIGIESMDTGGACRTYAALMSEGRKIVAALIINNNS